MKDMKKGVRILVFSIIPIILLASFVSAIRPAPPLMGTNAVANPFQELSNILVGLLKAVGDVFGSLTGVDPLGLGELVFTRMLIFILLTCILYVPAKIFAKRSTWIPLTIAAIVALLGARFITENMVTAILLPYGTLAITLSLLIPLILFGVLINTTEFPPWVRKLGWWLFFAAFLGLYIWRGSDINSQGRTLYALFALAAMIAAIIDKQIHKAIYQTALSAASGKVVKSRLKDKITELETSYKMKLEEIENDRRAHGGVHSMPGLFLEAQEIKKEIDAYNKALAKSS